MAYRIDYFRQGEKVGHTPQPGPLEEAIKIAWDGLVRHEADFARIIDVDGSGAEVWSGKRGEVAAQKD